MSSKQKVPVNSTAESFRWRIFQSGRPIVNKNSQFRVPIPLNFPRWISEIENIGLSPSQICTSFLSPPFSLTPTGPPRSSSANPPHAPHSARFRQRPQLDHQRPFSATPCPESLCKTRLAPGVHSARHIRKGASIVFTPHATSTSHAIAFIRWVKPPDKTHP